MNLLRFYICFAIFFICNLAAVASECTIYKPTNGETISTDMHFVCQWGNNNNLTIEIATESDFTNIVYSFNSNWVLVDGWLQYYVPIDNFENGTYYWRIAKDGEYSETRYFTIEGRPQKSDNYEIVRDQHDYPAVQISDNLPPATITSMWVRSDVTSNGLGQEAKGYYNKAMVVKDGIVYIGNGLYSSDICQLFRYNAYTGEQLETIDINFGSFTKPTYPLADMFIDDNGDVVMISEGLYNRDNHTIYVQSINVETGKVTKQYKCEIPTNTNSQKFINYDLKGSINNGNFTLYSALMPETSYSRLYEWKCENYSMSSPNWTPLDISSTEIYTSTIAVCAIDDDYILVDSRVSHPKIFSISNMKFIDEMPSNLIPTDYTSMGVNLFTHAGVKMMCYASSVNDGSKFNIITLPDAFPSTFEGSKLLWNLPQQSLGEVVHSVSHRMHARLVDATEPGSLVPKSHLYLYSSGNGIAAYAISHTSTTGIEDVVQEHDNTLKFHLNGREMILSQKVDQFEIYNMKGDMLKKVHDTSIVDLHDLSAGIYIGKSVNSAESFKFTLK